MPTLTITIPNKYFREAKKRARKAGFRTPMEWAQFLVTRNLGIEESPRLAPAKVIAEMKKTGLYKAELLRGLKKSLEYADKDR